MTTRTGSWQVMDLIDAHPGFDVLSDTLGALVDEGHPIAVGTPDLKYSNGLSKFEARHPDRFFQFGVAEQNLLSAAAGMAAVGLRSYVVGFASYLALLCFEQVRTDVAYTRMPVRMIGTHSGFTLGFYGSSHHATEDLAAMRAVAGLTVVCPADGPALAALLRATVDHPGPVYFRLGRGQEPDVYGPDQGFELGRAVAHGEGRDLTIVGTGSTVQPSLEAAERLRLQGHSVGVLDMHTVKPLDVEALLGASTQRLLTVEEHNVLGGLGGAVAEALASVAGAPPVHRHGVPDEFVIIGPPRALYRHYRLDAEGITTVALELLEGQPPAAAAGS